MTHTHTYSGKSDHGGTVQPPESYVKLAAWAAARGIDAVAMGSPYAPRSAAHYRRYDGLEQDRYYDPSFDPRQVLDADEIQGMLDQMAAHAAGRTCFFLDNETPKGRYGHMWWLGYHADMPAWHDYDQPFDRWMTGESRQEDFADEPMPYQRRPYLQILGIQRAHGALGFWAHPTSWWMGSGGQFTTNLATEMPAHVIADGFLDGLVVMGYQPCRPQYQALWFELLDRGYRVPGVAEMDVGLSDASLWRREDVMLTHARRLSDAMGTTALVSAFKTGRLFVSSGPFVEITVDGRQMGEIASTSKGAVHRVCLTALPKPGTAGLARVEIVGRGGAVLWSRDDFAGGTVEVMLPGLDERGYFIARAYGAGSDLSQWRKIRHFAMSNPVYLHPAGQHFNRPATTQVELEIRPDSPLSGAQLRLESVAGEVLGTATARGTIRETLPASGRLTFIAGDGWARTDYLVNANRALQDVQRYLYRGRFLKDYPALQAGEAPPEVWRMDEYVRAMQRVSLTY